MRKHYSWLMRSLVIFSLVVMAGCSFQTDDGVDKSRAGVIAVNAGTEARVFVDGQEVGMTNSLIEGVESGPRRIQVVAQDDKIIYEEILDVEAYGVTEFFTDETDFGLEIAQTNEQTDGKSLSTTEVSQKADAIIKTATGLIGTARYAHKYSPPKWFDCSGFTYYVFKQNGINLGTRDDDKQVKLGTKVLKADLRRGDLVFFYSTSSGPGNIGHVGIYMGDDKFVHIYKPGATVAISKLQGSSWWRSHYITARRIIK